MAAVWGVLAEALREHVQTYTVTKHVKSKYGVRYVVEGALSTPDERDPDVRSVGFIAEGEDLPQLVTT
ncbi:hypothetical protein HC928_04685 [bacterium]|nr:hypothetical protein [bacterium]